MSLSNSTSALWSMAPAASLGMALSVVTVISGPWVGGRREVSAQLKHHWQTEEKQGWVFCSKGN